MYIVIFSDGRRLEVPKGEARFWAVLSFEAANCHVFAMDRSPVPLHISDIV